MDRFEAYLLSLLLEGRSTLVEIEIAGKYRNRAMTLMVDYRNGEYTGGVKQVVKNLLIKFV